MGALPWYCRVVWSSWHLWNNRSWASEVSSSWIWFHKQNHSLYQRWEKNLEHLYFFTNKCCISCIIRKISPFSDTCFRHVMFKACKYAISDTRIKYMMKEVSDQIYKCFVKNNNLDKEIKEGEARMGTLHVRRLT